MRARCLLTMPEYAGTLAAVRCLGEHGVEVTVAGTDLLAPARWSKHTARFVRCPDPRNSDRFLAWLLAFGDANPGYFLYPTSDDLAWLFAANAAELGKRFVLYQPPVATLVRLLDKRKLYAACEEVGLGTVKTWFPQTEAEVVALEPTLPFPVMIKPRTQVMLETMNKGELVLEPRDLLPRYSAFVAKEHYLPPALADFGDVSRPMLQAFHLRASDGIYSVGGFIDREGQLLGVRASRKILQRPRKIGVGLCFEAAELHQEVAEGITRLCRAVGYFGLFEVELIAENGRFLLIDFNPRLYGQIGFDIARGLPLPLFAYLAATGNEEGLRAQAEAARAPAPTTAIYCDRFALDLLLLVRRLAGTTSAEERRRWRSWLAAHRDTTTDATFAEGDRLPGLVHAASNLVRSARYARGYYFTSVRDPA